MMDDLEKRLSEAHLSMLRGDLDRAGTLVESLGKQYPGHRDVARLRTALEKRTGTEHEAVERARDARYYLGLSSWWGRLRWKVVSAALTAAGSLLLVRGAALAFVGGGSRLDPFLSGFGIRTAGAELGCGAVCLALGVAGLFLLRRVMRGFRDWHDLDAEPEDDDDRDWLDGN